MAPVIDLPSGLGLDRKQMPQIPQAELQNFARFLANNGVTYHTGTASVSSILPTQKHLNADRVKEKLPNYLSDKEKWYIVSKEMRLIDGTHRWAAVKMKDPNTRVPIFKVDLPINKLIPLAHQFEGSSTKSVHETKLRRYIREQVRRIVEEVNRGASLAQLKAALQKYGVTNVKIDPNDIDAISPKGYVFNATDCHALVTSTWDNDTPAQIRYRFIKDLQQGLKKCDNEKCDVCNDY